MNSKLTLIASLFVAAFSEDKTDSIEVQTLRALIQMCQIKITPHTIEIYANDPEEDMDYFIEFSSAANGNVCVKAEQADDVLFDGCDTPRKRTIVFDNATDALYYATSVIGQFDLFVELRPNSAPPVSDENNLNDYDDDMDEDEAECEREFHEDFDDEHDKLEALFAEQDSKDAARESWRKLEIEEAQRKRSAWYDKYSQRPAFNRMLKDFGITLGMDKESTIAAVASIEMDCLVEFFDKYVTDMDLGQLDWDDGFDIIEHVMNEPRFTRVDKRSKVIDRLKQWVKL